MNDQPFRYYSYQMDSDEVKEFMKEHPESFETNLLRYLLNLDDDTSKLMRRGHHPEILFQCSISGFSPSLTTKSESYALLTENMGLIYNPFSEFNCRVFLKPNLHHFADSFIIVKKEMGTEVSKVTRRSASTVGRGIAGAAIAGPAGAVIGAASAIDKNNRGGVTKVKTRDVQLYSILLAGAVEDNDQEYWSEVTKIELYGEFKKLSIALFDSTELTVAKIMGRAVTDSYVDLSEKKLDEINVYKFKEVLWELITKIEGIDAPPHYYYGKNITDDEIRDVVYENFCSVINESCIENFTICDKEKLMISRVSDGVRYPTVDVSGRVEFINKETGNTISDEFIIQYWLKGEYGIIKYSVKKKPFLATNKKTEKNITVTATIIGFFIIIILYLFS